MDYQKAASYWEEKDTIKMEQNELRQEIEQFIASHNTCALATGCNGFVRCTPIEYNYMDGKFWLLSEGGLKFRALEGNKNVCLAIYDSFSGFGSLGGMQITGTAELVEPLSEEYLSLLAFKHISPEKLKKLPSVMHLIKITPVQIEFLSSALKKKGYDSRQKLDLSL